MDRTTSPKEQREYYVDGVECVVATHLDTYGYRQLKQNPRSLAAKSFQKHDKYRNVRASNVCMNSNVAKAMILAN